MRRVAAWIVLASLVAAGAARADGLPVLGIDVGGDGRRRAVGRGALRDACPPATDTVVARVGTSDGRIAASRLLRRGADDPGGRLRRLGVGLSGDGRTLVLIEPRVELPAQAHRPRGARHAQPRPRRGWIDLRGDFSFDAVSPRGGLVYLIQYLSPSDPTDYRVRAYDVRAGRLLAQPVVDPSEPDEKMGGTPVSRANGPGGRWAYTLYSRPGETPFVHALDTAKRTARTSSAPSALRCRARGRTASSPAPS